MDSFSMYVYILKLFKKIYIVNENTNDIIYQLDE